MIQQRSKRAQGSKGTIETKNLKDLPQNVQNAYNGYKQNGWKGNYSGQTKGTKSGKIYHNTNDYLPKTDSAGELILYREFDVNAPTPGVGRDAQRFVVGSDGSVYYTDSHYGQIESPSGLPSFVKIEIGSANYEE